MRDLPYRQILTVKAKVSLLLGLHINIRHTLLKVLWLLFQDSQDKELTVFIIVVQTYCRLCNLIFLIIDRPENLIIDKKENKFILQNKIKNVSKIRIENEGYGFKNNSNVRGSSPLEESSQR